MTADVSPKAGKREWAGLAVLALGTVLVSFDIFVLLLALPHLSADLGAKSTEQLWIMDVYGFMVGGFLVTMGTLGDRIGRRRLLLIGAAAFGAASVLAAYSNSTETLIAARALLGIAGATLAPSTLALISNMFRDPKQMGMAIGIWAGSFTIGAIIGPIIGGVMLEYFWWGSVFLIGVPPMLLLLVLAPVLVPEYRNPEAGKLDLVSVLLSLAAILPFIYGVKEVARDGWQPLPIAAIVVGLSLGVVFVRRQRVLSDPLLDVRLFSNRDFSLTLLALLFYSMLTGATLLFLTQSFQSVQGLSPLQAGLALLPGLAAGTASVMGAPILARRIRPAHLIGGGLVVVVVGLLLLTQAGPDSGAGLLMAGFAIWCLGGGPLLALGVNLVVGSAPPEKAGAASSLPQISNELGTALGIALVGTVGTVVYRTQIADTISSDVPAAAAKAAGESVAGAVDAAGGLSGQLGTALLDVAREAFANGLNTVAVISAVLLAGVAFFVVALLRHVPPLGAAEPVADEAGSAERLESRGTVDGAVEGVES